ncbi:ABC transporter substrate-binding protein [Atribacter laminatus]|uniref:Multiple sugar-binding protein n=1 Tax=Atribacter laminatus TaxID=2847778 RepID=A0A7T1F470_ATRLM|nr:extracellular solute-binding protein [Atribacter laminatus]QPM69151.1 Multiple sugar-binding protein [Atribacter laminatus]
MKSRLTASILIFSLVVFMAFSLITVVGAQQITLSLWDQRNDSREQEAIKYIIDIFEKEHPNVKISRRVMPNLEADQMVRMAFAGGTPPDISESEDPYTMIETFKQGKLLDLTEWYEKYGDRYPQSAKSAMSFEGRYVAVPMIGFTTEAVFYNKKLFNEMGLTEPTEYAELYNIFETAKGKNYIPIALGANEGWPAQHIYQHFLNQTVSAEAINNMIDRRDPNQGPKWTDPGWLKAAEYFDDLRTKEFFSPGAAMNSMDMAKMEQFGDRALFLFTGNWYTSYDMPPDYEWGFFWFPRIKGEYGFDRDDQLVDFFANLQISKTTQYPELCLEFLETWTRPEVMYNSWFKIANNLPIVIGSAPDEELDEFQNAQLDIVETNTGTYRFMDVWSPPAVGFGALYNDMTALTAGQITPQEMCEHMEKIHVEELQKLMQ